MYERDGIIYADNENPVDTIKVIGFKVLENHQLLLTFSNHEKKVYDVSKLFDYPAFQPLKDVEVFRDAQLILNTVTWCDESIDIAPETLYIEGVSLNE